jgi:hypothetical protein
MTGDYSVRYGPTTEDLARDFWERCYHDRLHPDWEHHSQEGRAEAADADVEEWRKRWDKQEPTQAIRDELGRIGVAMAEDVMATSPQDLARESSENTVARYEAERCCAMNTYENFRRCIFLVGHGGQHSTGDTMWPNADTQPAPEPETVESLLREIGHAVRLSTVDAPGRWRAGSTDTGIAMYGYTVLDAVRALRDQLRGAK